ncbi:unnamed protein product [Prunus armeniaca]
MDSNITTELVASSPSPSTNSWKYDVFLSFRGADTRYSFTDHLHSSLLRRGINTFMDDDQLERGQDISEVLNQAIRESRIFIIIFSENYASSSWCLEELARIIEYKNPQQQIVIPVFYKVDPAHVRNQRGPFDEAFVQHESRFKDDLEKVSRWRAALKEAANLAGMKVNNFGHESKIIHEITEMVLLKLNRVYLTYGTNYPVEIDSRLQEMNDLLGDGVTDVRMVGIWGMGGIGKTTLAKAVYNSVAHKFEGSCFLGNVREISEAQGGLVRLQKTLLHNILGLKISIKDVYSGVNIIKRKLCDKRVLLIIDDVDDLNQLKYLAGSSGWFGVGSRIIITTRNLHFLHAHGVDFTYLVREVESDEALELFSSNAFPTSRLPDDYQVLARRFVGYAQGIPLALTAMGSLLYKKSIDEWQSILERYERAPASNIHEILKITKKALDHHIKRPEENVLTNVEEHAGGLNEVVNTAKLLGVETFSRTQEEERIQGHINRTDDVTIVWIVEKKFIGDPKGLFEGCFNRMEQNEDENNVNLVEGDETFSSIQEEDLLGKPPGTDDALNKVENTEKLVEGDQTFSSTQEEDRLEGKIQGTNYITGQNEDENTEQLVEGDKTFSSSQEEDLLLQRKTPGTDDALYKAETTEKLVDGDETNSSSQEEDRLQGKIQGTDDITEPNEAESTSTQVVETVEAKILGTEDVTGVLIEAASTNCLLEGDETFSSTLEVETLHAKIPETEDVTGITEATSVEKFLEGDEAFPTTDAVERLHEKIPGSDGDITHDCVEKFIEGDEIASGTQALQTLQGRSPNTDTEDVTGVNATEGTEGFPGRDETSSATEKLEMLRIHIDDVIADTVEWIFLILSFFLEILAAICDQFFSPGNPQFALTGMWLASVALFFYICELILKCKNGESSSPRLEMFPDIFGLICGISQWLSTIARFVCMLKGMESPFRVNILPVIFLGCLGARKLIVNNKRCKTENRIELTSIVHVPKNGPTPDEAQTEKGS